jgi:hypothetical protein
MRVAVIGATGFVGSYVVDLLLEQGHDVNQLVRPGSEHKARHADSTRIVPGSIDSASSLSELVADCDAVIYSVGILRESPRKGITFENTQFGKPRSVQKNGCMPAISKQRSSGHQLSLVTLEGEWSSRHSYSAIWCRSQFQQ